MLQPKPPKKISEAVEFGRVLFDVLKLNQGVTFPRLPASGNSGDELINPAAVDSSLSVMLARLSHSGW